MVTDYKNIDNLITEFEEHIKSVLMETDVKADKIVNCLLEDENSSNVVSDILVRQNVELGKMFNDVLHTKVETLAIFPCCDYILKNMAIFEKCFPNIILCDNKKRGSVYNGIEVVDLDEMDKYDCDIDAYLLSTSNRELQDLFKRKVDTNKMISWRVFARQIIYEHAKVGKFKQIEIALERIRSAKQPFVILAGKSYPNVYTPIYKTLESRGYDIFIISLQSLATHAGSNELTMNDAVPFKEKYVVNVYDMLYFLKQLDRGVLWIIDETFYGHNWDCEKNVPGYVYPSVLMRMAKVPTILNLYDVFRPFAKGMEFEEDAIKVYKNMVKSASGVILSSNTKETLSFLKTTLSIEKPIISFFRYNFAAKKKQTKLTKGFHVVVVGIFLGEHKDPLRLNTHKHIKTLLEQGIDVHYYSNNSVAAKYYEVLNDYEKALFHMHSSILDQRELMYEISKYNAGWMVHDTQVFINLMANLKTQFLKDLFYMFHQTTVPSCISLFGNAGLPVFVNRSMQGLIHEYPPEFTIPIKVSEISNIKSIINGLDLNNIYKKIDLNKDQFAVEKNVEKLISFINSV